MASSGATLQLGFGMIVGMLAFMRVHMRLVVAVAVRVHMRLVVAVAVRVHMLLVVAVAVCTCFAMLVRVLGRVLLSCLEVFREILECNHPLAVL